MARESAVACQIHHLIPEDECLGVSAISVRLAQTGFGTKSIFVIMGWQRILWLLHCACLLAVSQSPPTDQISYLDNGTIRIGVNLSLGGAITFLSFRGGANMINSADYGRQIQQSYYSGPKPYGTAHPSWKNWPWNPIGTGDVYRNRSRVIGHSNDGQTLWVKTIPLHWALNNVACECTFETWIRLEGKVARVRARINNYRLDRTQYQAFSQEEPAVYTNGTWYRLYTYDGLDPFTKAAPRRIENAGPPWQHWQATEYWAALIDDSGSGLGVFHPGVFTFTGGFHGKPNTGGPKDGSTGYISPVRREILDHNIRYDYEYFLIGGTLDEIRAYVYAHRPDPRPDFTFREDRQHWTYRNASDPGMPIPGFLRVAATGGNAQMISPPGMWRAGDVPRLYIRAAHHTAGTQARLYWSGPGKPYSEERSITFAVKNDGDLHTYELDLSAQSQWTGWITGVRLDPAISVAVGEYVDVYSISYRQPGP